MKSSLFISFYVSNLSMRRFVFFIKKVEILIFHWFYWGTFDMVLSRFSVMLKSWENGNRSFTVVKLSISTPRRVACFSRFVLFCLFSFHDHLCGTRASPGILPGHPWAITWDLQGCPRAPHGAPQDSPGYPLGVMLKDRGRALSEQ